MKSNPARKRSSAKTIVGVCCLGVAAIVVVPGLILMWRVNQNAPKLISPDGSRNDFDFAGYKFASHEVKFCSKTTGNVFSIPLRDLWEGKATVRVNNGEVSVSSSREAGSLPAWLPAYPNSMMLPRNIDVKMREALGSTVMFATKDPVAKVVRFYETKLYEAEFVTQESRAGTQGEVTKITGIKGEAEYVVTLNIYLSGDQTVVMAGFLERKP